MKGVEALLETVVGQKLVGFKTTNGGDLVLAFETNDKKDVDVLTILHDSILEDQLNTSICVNILLGFVLTVLVVKLFL